MEDAYTWQSIFAHKLLEIDLRLIWLYFTFQILSNISLKCYWSQVHVSQATGPWHRALRSLLQTRHTSLGDHRETWTHFPRATNHHLLRKPCSGLKQMDTLQSPVREDMQAADQTTHRLPMTQAKGPWIRRFLMLRHIRRKCPVNLVQSSMDQHLVRYLDMSNLEVTYDVAENRRPFYSVRPVPG